MASICSSVLFFHAATGPKLANLPSGRKNGNAAAGLKRLYLSNPHNAQMVRLLWCVLGRQELLTQRLAILPLDGNTWNGGDMSCGSSTFFSGNTYVLGIYIPSTCSGSGSPQRQQRKLRWRQRWRSRTAVSIRHKRNMWLSIIMLAGGLGNKCNGGSDSMLLEIIG